METQNSVDDNLCVFSASYAVDLTHDFLNRRVAEDAENAQRKTEAEKDSETELGGVIMDSTLAAVASLFHVNDQLFHRALEGVKEEDLMRIPQEGSNPLIWIAGHLTTSRVSLTRLAGERLDNPWSKIFARGATVDSNVTYPAITKITSLWDTSTKSLMARLEQLTDEQLAEQPSFPVPTGDKTTRGAIIFLNFHETYHIGQMAYLRKWLGYSQLVG